MKMHSETVSRFTHTHAGSGVNRDNESRTLKVVVLTAVTMIVEIAAGYFTGSMALLADGWHMGTHAFALGISYAAYMLARKHDRSEFFSFGTGKFGILAGYTSALSLGLVAVWMMYESVWRLFQPVHIDFSTAIMVTVIGLVVNLLSVFILHHHEPHDHDHDHHHHHHDHNYQSAYIHVIADALTSILALVALLSGRYFGWWFLDPVMGVVGGLLISKWAWSLLLTTGVILLDGSVEAEIRGQVRALIEEDQDSRIADLHMWRINSESMAVIVSVVTGKGRNAEEYHQRLNGRIANLAHLSVEVHQCEDCRC